MSHTHDLPEWCEALAFGSLSWLACSLLVVALAPADFGPPLRDAAVTAAALLMLLTLHAPNGAAR